jgi:hypothetical protein
VAQSFLSRGTFVPGDIYTRGTGGAGGGPAGPTPPGAAAPPKSANDYAGYGGYPGYQQVSGLYKYCSFLRTSDLPIFLPALSHLPSWLVIILVVWSLGS